LQTGKAIEKQFDKAQIQVTITPSYYNMRALIEKQPDGLNRALKAYQTLGIPVQAVPIRGGTDGAMLTYLGVPTPNLATGGENYHGKYEFLVLEDAEMMVKILLEIIRNPN